MEKFIDKNLTAGNWHCGQCGAYNQIAIAKFCGHCGARRVLPQLYLFSSSDHSEDNAVNSTVYQPKQEPHIKKAKKKEPFLVRLVKFFRNPEKTFKLVVGTACCLLMTSVLCGYKMYSSSDTVRITHTKFSDISLDHPIYDVCKKLLSINAIGFRRNREFAPYEQISTAEWNHALSQAAKRLGRDYTMSAYFFPEEEISLESLNEKLQTLNPEGPELSDTNRLQIFYTLEQTLFD